MRFFVRRSEIPPDVPRLAQRRRRARKIAFGEEDCTRRVRGRRGAGAGLQSARDLRQLVGGRARVLEIAGRQQNLDCCRKRSGASGTSRACRAAHCGWMRPRRRSRPCARRSSDSPGCGLRPRSFARMYAASAFSNSPRSRWISPSAVERRARRRPAAQQLARRPVHPRAARVPVAAQLHDFGAVEETLAAIAHETWLRGAPSRERGRPLVGTAQIEDLLACLQHAAVDIARQHRRHVSRDRPRPSPRRAGRHPRGRRRDGSARARAPDTRATRDRDRQTGWRSPSACLKSVVTAAGSPCTMR